MCNLHVFVESSRNNVVDNETGANRPADLCYKSVWLWRQRFSEKSFKKNIKRQPLGVSKQVLYKHSYVYNWYKIKQHRKKIFLFSIDNSVTCGQNWKFQ